MSWLTGASMPKRASRRRPAAPRSTDYEEIANGIFSLSAALQRLESRLRREANENGDLAEVGALALALKKVMSSENRPEAEIDAVKVFIQKGTIEKRADWLMKFLVSLAWRVVLEDLTPSEALNEANDARLTYGDPKSPARVPALQEAMTRGRLLGARVSQVYSLLASGSSARYQGETAKHESFTDKATDAVGGASARVRGRRGTRGPLGELIESVGHRMLADLQARDKTHDGLVTSRPVVSTHGRQRKPLPPRKGRLPAT